MKRMKSRYPSLDGLRGFAILLVVLNHINSFSEKNWVISRIPFTFLQQIYYTIASGPFGVQIFFVLSGFLISFFYVEVLHPVIFFQKRYTRIFPVLITIVIFLWIVTYNRFTSSVYVQIPLLLVTILVAGFIWKYIKRRKSELINKRIFLSFTFVQMVVLLFAIILQFQVFHFPKLQPNNHLFMLLSNTTLTFTAFNGNGFEQVFWSLVPEVLFYLLYPILVIRLVHYGKKNGIWVSLLLVVVTSFLLFYLDNIFPFFLARGSSFIAGAVAGTIYSSQANVWNNMKLWLKLPVIHAVLLLLFILLLWGDINLGIYLTSYSKLYYYVASWFISLVLLASLIEKTILYKIFANKLFIFLGLISFPMYLIHPTTIRWNYALYLHLIRLQAFHAIIFILIFITTIATTVVVSYFIHIFLERLYFEK